MPIEQKSYGWNRKAFEDFLGSSIAPQVMPPWKRVISARRGLRTRRRGTVKPLRGSFLKHYRRFPLYTAFLGQALSFGLRQTSHSLSVGFVSNLSSRSQYVIRARRSKHVVRENQINYWVKTIFVVRIKVRENKEPRMIVYSDLCLILSNLRAAQSASQSVKKSTKCSKQGGGGQRRFVKIKLDPVGSTVRYEMTKLCTGSV